MSLTVDHFKFTGSVQIEKESSFTWTSPSNIALVKYWGKYKNQIPANPSISFTLDRCYTQTKTTFTPSETLSFEVYVDGQLKDSFRPKIEKFIQSILPYCPYLSNVSLKIETQNTFPHSSGIASSASGMSALALCIMSLEKSINPSIEDETFKLKASFLARIGSGSAARSIFPKLASWGKSEALENSSDLVGKVFENAHPYYQSFQDCILIIDEGEKVVSSTVGHGLMNDHPYAQNRFVQANDHLSKIIEILQSPDRIDDFISIVESEALTLHAMMMTSQPYFILMKPNTLRAIDLIWEYRRENNSKICFTLDAGANVHVLYPENEKVTINKFIQQKLAPLCKDQKVIFDQVGNGPKQL